MSDGFWSHAFGSLGDNLSIINAVAGDVEDNLNPFSDAFMSGDAGQTAAEVERQRALEQGRAYDQAKVDRSKDGGLATVGTAAEETGDQVGAKVGEVVDGAAAVAGGALDMLFNPWVLGAVAVVVVLVIAAPYVAPVAAKALA